MDVVVNAAIQSPLVRTLAATKGKGDSFVHRIKDNVPPVSFGKVELVPNGGAVGTYNRNYQFKIPQYGYWRGFILKFQGSENGLGTQVVQDLYNSLTTDAQVTRFYGQSDQVVYATYNKNNLFGSQRTAYGATAPNDQTFVPQGWVSPFDGNVRSGNYDPWEAMWLRLNGGNSYGNQAATGSYPNPEVVTAKGDARIAPFRQVPRFDALNAFGRNVHCIGDENYDDGNTAGSNVLQPAACGYNINNASTGTSVIAVTSFTPVNAVPSGASLTNNVLSGTTTLANVPKDAVLSNNVPVGASILAGINNVPYAPIGTWSNTLNVVTSASISASVHFPTSTAAWSSDTNAIRASNISTNFWPSSPGVWTYTTSALQGTTFNSNVPASVTVNTTNVPQSTLGWATDTSVLRSSTIGGSGAGESVAFGMQIVRDDVPYNQSTSQNAVFTNMASGNKADAVAADCAVSTTTKPLILPNTSTLGSDELHPSTWVPTSNNNNWNLLSNALSTAAGNLVNNVPKNADNGAGVGNAGVHVPYASSSNLLDGVAGGNGGSVNLRGGIPYNTTYVGSGGKVVYSAGTVTDLTNVHTGSTLVSNVPSGTSNITAGSGVAISGTGGGTSAQNVPFNSAFIGASSTNRVPFATSAGGVADVTSVPTSASSVQNVPRSSTVIGQLTGIPYNSTGTVSNVPSGTSLDSTVMSTTGSSNRSNVPYDVTLVNNVIADAETIETFDASHLNVSGELDWSYLVPFDGCMFHQVPRYTSGAQANFFLQPDGQYTATNGNNGGSRGWAASTPPLYNTNTQMRNRYLGQRLASTYDWCSQANLSRYLGALMVQRITLSTHNRILQTIYPVETLARIHRMPTDQKKRYLSLIRPHINTGPSSIAQGDTQTPGYTGGINTTGVSWMRTAEAAYGTYRTWTCYFPCFFSFFEEPGNNLDTRFIENLTVDVLVQPMQNIYDPCDLGLRADQLGTTYNFGDTTQDDRAVLTTYTGFHSQEFRQRVAIINEALTVSGLAYYHNFHDTTSQSIRDHNFRPDVPGNILGYNTYAEPPVPCPASAVCQGASININLSCTNLTTEIVFCVRRRQKDVAAHPQLASFPFENCMTTLPIASVALSASGQLLYYGTGVECMLADQWDFSLNHAKSGDATSNDSSLYADSHESYYAQSKPTCDGFFAYRIPFSFSTDRTYNSGCLALQTLNNPVLSIQLLPLHGWVINDDNLAFRMGSLLNLSENLNQRECDTQTIFDNDFQVEIYANYFQLVRIDSNTGAISKSIDL